MSGISHKHLCWQMFQPQQALFLFFRPVNAPLPYFELSQAYHVIIPGSSFKSESNCSPLTMSSSVTPSWTRKITTCRKCLSLVMPDVCAMLIGKINWFLTVDQITKGIVSRNTLRFSSVEWSELPLARSRSRSARVEGV